MTREEEIQKSYSRLHNIWHGMKQRCLNKNATGYNNYGGRGISIYKEWLQYRNFKEWSLNNGYNDTLSIDRIDTNGNYEPNNCRFVDSFVQLNNTTRNVKVEFNGVLLTIGELARISGVNYRTLHNRIVRGGWKVENAIDRNINGRVFINGRKIEKCDKNGKHICYYNSITDAIKANDCGRHISDVCLGKRKSCGGYVWKYID